MATVRLASEGEMPLAISMPRDAGSEAARCAIGKCHGNHGLSFCSLADTNRRKHKSRPQTGGAACEGRAIAWFGVASTG